MTLAASSPARILVVGPHAELAAVLHAHAAGAGWLLYTAPGPAELEPLVRAGCNSRSVQAKMCAEGAGVAVLPCAIGDRLGGIERLRLGDEPPRRDVWIGYHRDLGRLARLRALLDLTLARLAD